VLTALVLVGYLVAALAALLVVALMAALIWFTQGPELLERIQSNPDNLSYMFEDPTTALLANLFGLLAMLVAFRVLAPFMLAAFLAAGDDSLGFRQSLSLSGPRTWGFIGALILQTLLIDLALLLLILAGIWLAIRLYFAPQIFASEGCGAAPSLRRSFDLTRGRFWAVLGRVIVVGLVASLIMIVPIVGWVVGGTLLFVALAELASDLGVGAGAPAPSRR
jgi:hypothetical protein